jgi:hypothetical protein
MEQIQTVIISNPSDMSNPNPFHFPSKSISKFKSMSNSSPIEDTNPNPIQLKYRSKLKTNFIPISNPQPIP